VSGCVVRLTAALIASSGAAQAREAAARVVLATAENASPLLREAVVRARGELAAVGLAADVELVSAHRSAARELPSDVYGMLELEQRGGLLVIRAWAPRATHPLEARIELQSPAATAEVIAVRAVETLRAAMLEFAQTQRGEVPGAVRGFTRFEPQPKVAEVVAPPASSLPPLAFWAGPALSLHAGTSPDLSGQLGVLVGASFAFAAAAFETSLSDLKLEAEQGSATVRRRAVWLQLGARLRPARSWEVTTRAGAGFASFAVEGAGEPGYRGKSTSHGSPAFMLSLGGSYWATRSFGLYGSVGVRLASDAPRIRIARRDVITLDRPSFVGSVGVNVGVF
jgi:hypothetical protein